MLHWRVQKLLRFHIKTLNFQIKAIFIKADTIPFVGKMSWKAEEIILAYPERSWKTSTFSASMLLFRPLQIIYFSPTQVFHQAFGSRSTTTHEKAGDRVKCPRTPNKQGPLGSHNKVFLQGVQKENRSQDTTQVSSWWTKGRWLKSENVWGWRMAICHLSPTENNFQTPPNI